MSCTYADVLRTEDPRIREMFDVEAETISQGAVVMPDPMPALNRLRDAGPIP